MSFLRRFDVAFSILGNARNNFRGDEFISYLKGFKIIYIAKYKK